MKVKPRNSQEILKTTLNEIKNDKKKNLNYNFLTSNSTNKKNPEPKKPDITRFSLLKPDNLLKCLEDYNNISLNPKFFKQPPQEILLENPNKREKKVKFIKSEKTNNIAVKFHNDIISKNDSAIYESLAGIFNETNLRSATLGQSILNFSTKTMKMNMKYLAFPLRFQMGLSLDGGA